ncbi:hypothetical protein [Komagataeibacter oboediens]|uniref:Transposase n=1 Tax=Komagataeibacter oboediens TaxID=65958 RepID=A0ABS5SND8_9PROT|nr:hypothetical protein [Komagataeibacter oboediens]MBT0675723.1 hypothetical protein [Komagataeibacter oboediens]MBT0678270.1 hypothetical protein [Komagataeibacter oboediens]
MSPFFKKAAFLEAFCKKLRQKLLAIWQAEDNRPDRAVVIPCRDEGGKNA